MKTIIAGSRDITDYELVKNAIKYSGFDITEVVCGNARGVDTLGKNWANSKGIPVKFFNANWNTFGKSAGFRRNAEMAKYADALIAIWNGVSKGTFSMINLAHDRNLEIYILRTDLSTLEKHYE